MTSATVRFKGKLARGPAVSVADRHHSLRRGIVTMTRSAYVQVRCTVVALWSERHQRYAAKTGLKRQNLTQNYGFAVSSFLRPFRDFARNGWPLRGSSGPGGWVVLRSADGR